MAYRGDGSVESAKRALERVQTLGGMPGAYIERRGDVTAVCHGKYPSPQDPKAQADLKNIREMEFGGERPFAGAVLAPPVGPPPQGGTPEYNLAGVKKLEGPEALYTLQIGFYGREDRKAPASSELAEFRKAAEEAVALLRREGERAYYYHGPNGSMVTMGVFGKDAVDAVTLRYVDPTLKQLQERYPYNLVNGKAVREVVGRKKSDGQKAERLQPSTLVAIPD